MKNVIKNGKFRAITLSQNCSNCSEGFRDGAARFILGAFPMEQFCSYRCAERYLETHQPEEEAIPLQASKGGGNPPVGGKPAISFFPE